MDCLAIDFGCGQNRGIRRMDFPRHSSHQFLPRQGMYCLLLSIGLNPRLLSPQLFSSSVSISPSCCFRQSLDHPWTNPTSHSPRPRDLHEVHVIFSSMLPSLADPVIREHRDVIRDDFHIHVDSSNHPTFGAYVSPSTPESRLFVPASNPSHESSSCNWSTCVTATPPSESMTIRR